MEKKDVKMINDQCGNEKNFGDHCLQMKSSFLKRKYPEKLIDSDMKKVRFFPTNLQNKKREKGVPFVVTYHPIKQDYSRQYASP